MKNDREALLQTILSLQQENIGLQDYKRKQAEDIMNLGQEVGRLTTQVEAAESTIEELRRQLAKAEASDARNPCM